MSDNLSLTSTCMQVLIEKGFRRIKDGHNKSDRESLAYTATGMVFWVGCLIWILVDVRIGDSNSLNTLGLPFQ